MHAEAVEKYKCAPQEILSLFGRLFRVAIGLYGLNTSESPLGPTCLSARQLKSIPTTREPMLSHQPSCTPSSCSSSSSPHI